MKRQWQGLNAWLDSRTGIHTAVRNFLYEDIPASSGWRQVFGSVALWWRERLSAILHHALSGLRAFHHPGRLTAFLALTALIWCGDAASTVIAASALGLGIAFPAAFLLLASLGLASALPSTPGYVGIFQFVAVTVLVPFGLTRSDAIAYILVAQAMSYVTIGVWGSIAIARYRALRRAA